MDDEGGAGIDRLLGIMARLRDPQGGCPWDREQTLATIVPHTLEEAYEVADAIERGALDELPGELGDLLFQVVFYARIAEEAGLFAFADVVAAIADKLERRHPHVFGDAQVADAQAQTVAWEEHKRAERETRGAGPPAGALDGIAAGLPALTRAGKVQGRAARVGFDWPDIAPVWDKLAEEIDELRSAATAAPREQRRIDDELGDLLFTCVNLARHAGVEPEGALRRATARFERRFRHVESRLRAQGRTPQTATAAELDRLWEEAKRAPG